MNVNIQGEKITVNIYKYGSAAGLINITIPADTPVEEALETAEIPVAETDNVRVNGNEVEEAAPLKAGDTVTVAQNVAGGAGL